MSETTLVIYCEFNNPIERDAAKSFLSKGLGPDFEDEVEEPLRPLFLALEDIQYPDTISKWGKSGMLIIFDVLEVSEERYDEDEAKGIMNKLATGGASKVYAYFYDDGENEVYWSLVDGRVNKIFSPGQSKILEHIIFDLDDEKRLAKVIEFFETGRL